MIMVCGGGTGGHLYPGVAMAGEFLRQRPETQVLFLVSSRKIDQQILTQEGWPYINLPIKNLRGFSWRTAGAMLSLIQSIKQAMGIIRRYRPSLIVGLGAYPSVPGLVAGKLCGIPLMIHEQNIFPGAANRLLSRWAKRIFLSYAETEKYLGGAAQDKIIVTGNPVRQEYSYAQARPREEEYASFGLEAGKFTLLVFGGSTGSRRINEAVMEGLAHLPPERAARLQLIHQTGEEDFQKVVDNLRGQGLKRIVLPYIKRMIEAYRLADLVVCRAGATTLAELTTLGKPAILIPYPYAAEDHQMVNAQALQRAGAAELIADRELTGDRLWQEVFKLMDNPGQLTDMEKECRKLGKPEAAQRMVEESLAVIEGDQ